MITPMDIHNKTFSRQIRGYAQDEVNTFLEELAKDYERIYREHREMEEEMDTIRTIREAQNEAHKIVADAEAARRKMNADLLKTEGDMNLYIEKLLSNFKSALSLIESAKAVQAPQPVEDGTAQAAPAAAEAPKAEEPKEEAKEEPAPAAPEAVPAAETPAGGNLFDQAAATAKGEEPAAPAEDRE